jgi:hypothetical protein
MLRKTGTTLRSHFAARLPPLPVLTQPIQPRRPRRRSRLGARPGSTERSTTKSQVPGVERCRQCNRHRSRPPRRRACKARRQAPLQPRPTLQTQRRASHRPAPRQPVWRPHRCSLRSTRRTRLRACAMMTRVVLQAPRRCDSCFDTATGVELRITSFTLQSGQTQLRHPRSFPFVRSDRRQNKKSTTQFR